MILERVAFLGGAPRPGAASAFVVTIDDASTVSIYEQIVAQAQEAVATGRVRPGDRLPPVRRLADELDIAPGTVAAFHLGASASEVRAALEKAMVGIYNGGAGGDE